MNRQNKGRLYRICIPAARDKITIGPIVICLGLLALFLGIWKPLAAQIPAAGSPDARMVSITQPSGAIRISTNLVTVPVSVTDSRGSTVLDLNADDFLVEEDGRSENILTLIKAGQSPLQLSLIMDLSGSIHSDFEFQQKAASRFLEKVWKPGDCVSIISVGKQPEVQLTSSSSLNEALRTIEGLEPTEDATAFFDSIAMASRLLNQSTAPNTRQATVIFSDGEDNRSNIPFKEALSALQHSNTVVYSINPSGPSIRLNEISRKGQELLGQLANTTGGEAFVSNHLSDLDGIYNRIAVELRALYLLSYYSSDTHTDGSFRYISVSIPEDPGLIIRAREGYYSIRMSSQRIH